MIVGVPVSVPECSAQRNPTCHLRTYSRTDAADRTHREYHPTYTLPALHALIVAMLIGTHCRDGSAGVVIDSPSAIVPVSVASSVVTHTASHGPSVIAVALGVCARIDVIVAAMRCTPDPVMRRSADCIVLMSCLRASDQTHRYQHTHQIAQRGVVSR